MVVSPHDLHFWWLKKYLWCKSSGVPFLQLAIGGTPTRVGPLSERLKSSSLENILVGMAMFHEGISRYIMVYPIFWYHLTVTYNHTHIYI